MKEISLNILDIAQNSVKAGAGTVRIELKETPETLFVSISDDGCGMKPDFLAAVTDPFTTTRTTRNVGLGIPLFKLACEQTGGEFSIVSRDSENFPTDHGTTTSALFYKTSIDYTPLGDVISTLTVLIQGAPEIRWVFTHTLPGGEVRLDTAELQEALGGVPLSHPEVVAWIADYLKEQYDGANGNPCPSI